jgi:hypothetical protein
MHFPTLFLRQMSTPPQSGGSSSRLHENASRTISPILSLLNSSIQKPYFFTMEASACALTTNNADDATARISISPVEGKLRTNEVMTPEVKVEETSTNECITDKENIDFMTPRLICQESEEGVSKVSAGTRTKRKLEQVEGLISSQETARPIGRFCRSGIVDPLFTRVINVQVKDSKEFVSPTKVRAIIKYTFPW